MNLQEFKKHNLGITREKFGKIYTFVDFGNVNYWYEKDERGWNNKHLGVDKKLAVDIKKLAEFIGIFSSHKRFYFGLDRNKPKSIRIITKARENFDKTITKPIQNVKHYIDWHEKSTTTRKINHDDKGEYVIIPKCNFDVEICVDAVRYITKYDTFCLFSGDADFAYLLEFLKRNKKKVILFSAGFVMKALKEKADLNVNAQIIKRNITFIKSTKRKSRR